MKYDKYTNSEIKLLDIQIIATILFIVSLILSIILTYDEKLTIIDNKGLFTNKQARRISLFNRVFVVILAIVFVYCNYISEKIAEYRKDETKYLKLQLFSGELSLIASIIVLYIVYKNQSNENFDVADTENPVL